MQKKAETKIHALNPEIPKDLQANWHYPSQSQLYIPKINFHIFASTNNNNSKKCRIYVSNKTFEKDYFI